MQVKNNPFRVVALAVLALGLASTTGHAATFTVDSLLDDAFSNDSDPGDGVCRESFPNSTTCTLRAAIQEANALAGPDRIEFSVAGEIGPDSGNLGALPVITDDLVINGTNAPGWSPLKPTVYLDGAAVNAADSSFTAGLEVTAGSLEVYGLGIVAFPGQGIDFDNGAGGGRVDGCVIGLDANGDPANHPKSLSTIGIRLRGSGALIGTSFGNVISGNVADGIQIFGDANIIARNIIGMDLAGITARGNGGNGIFLWPTADNNVIGGSDAGSNPGNHIANNVGAGIVVDGTGNQVDGNTLGFKNESGPFFNAQTNGIEVAGSGHLIGGNVGNRIIDHFGVGNAGIRLGRSTPGGDIPATNVIVAGNDIGNDSVSGVQWGIEIAVAGSTSNTIQDNRIGDATGIGIMIRANDNLITRNRVGIDAALATGPGIPSGIALRSSNNEVTFNEIGNTTFTAGITIKGSSNDINFNDIGVAAGLGDVGNAGAGIRLTFESNDNLIHGNRIFNNGGPGIEFNVGSGFGNKIFGNSIQRNAGIGIDFVEFESGIGNVHGPTENDPGDGDFGSNLRMNHPEFGEAVPIPGTSPIETVVTFRVDSEPANQAYPIKVDFYRADDYGERQGTAFLASATFDTFGTEETITLELPAGVGIDRHFTALATDADGNTSEFAPARSLGETIFRDSYED